MENLRELLIEELKDLYSAEKQIVKALPKIIRGAASQELRRVRFSRCQGAAYPFRFGDVGDGGAGGECLRDAEEAAFAAEFRSGFGLCFFGDWCLAFAHACQSARQARVMRSISASLERSPKPSAHVRDGCSTASVREPIGLH